MPCIEEQGDIRKTERFARFDRHIDLASRMKSLGNKLESKCTMLTVAQQVPAL
jgi:hypothetical protein